MSSILTALKKVEQQDSEPGSSRKIKLNIQHRLNLTRTAPPETDAFPQKLLIPALFCVVIAAGLGGFYFFKPAEKPPAAVPPVQKEKPAPHPVTQPEKTNPKPAPAPETAEIIAGQTQPAPVPETVQSTAGQTQPPEKITSPTVPLPPAPIPQPQRRITVPVTETPRPAAKKTDPLPPTSEPVKTVAIKAPLEKQQSPQTAESPLPDKADTPQNDLADTPVRAAKKPPVEDIPETNIPEIEDESIKIQAISWSPSAEDRIAVVNNKIVSEKELIEGFRIARIHKDEIILKRDGKYFSLKFRYR